MGIHGNSSSGGGGTPDRGSAKVRGRMSALCIPRWRTPLPTHTSQTHTVIIFAERVETPWARRGRPWLCTSRLDGTEAVNLFLHRAPQSTGKEKISKASKMICPSSKAPGRRLPQRQRSLPRRIAHFLPLLHLAEAFSQHVLAPVPLNYVCGVLVVEF